MYKLTPSAFNPPPATFQAGIGGKIIDNKTEEKDPNGLDVHDAGAKSDSGKADCGLLGFFGRSLYAVSEVGTAGAKKYSRGGFLSVEDGFNRYTAAMLRHYFKEGREEYDTDPELQKYLDEPCLHAAQVAWNALARLEMMLIDKENK